MPRPRTTAVPRSPMAGTNTRRNGGPRVTSRTTLRAVGRLERQRLLLRWLLGRWYLGWRRVELFVPGLGGGYLVRHRHDRPAPEQRAVLQGLARQPGLRPHDQHLVLGPVRLHRRRHLGRWRYLGWRR